MLRVAAQLISFGLAMSSFGAETQEPKTASVLGGFPSDSMALEVPVHKQPRFEDVVTPIANDRAVPQAWLRNGRPTYQGSVYRVNPRSTAAELSPEAQELMTQALARANFTPVERLEHFDWCDAPDIAIVGWFVWVEDAVVTPMGWLFTVRVSPRLERASSLATLTSDFRLECFYLDRNGWLEYLGSQGNPPTKRGSIFGS